MFQPVSESLTVPIIVKTIVDSQLTPPTKTVEEQDKEKEKSI